MSHGYPSSDKPAESMAPPPRSMSDFPTSEGTDQVSLSALCQAQIALIAAKDARVANLEQQLTVARAMVIDRDAEVAQLTAELAVLRSVLHGQEPLARQHPLPDAPPPE